MLMAEVAETSRSVMRSGAWLYLDEITHRALNDYTAMLCTIRRASLSVSDEAAGQALNEVAIRLGAAAAAWQALRPPSGNAPRNLDEDLAALCSAFSASILADRHIKLSLAVDPVTVTGRRSWQILLIVAELMLNASRHAFRRREEGSIHVEMRVRGGMIQCAVIDDGEAAPSISPGRGSAILEGLAGELGGMLLRTHTAHGSTVVLRVPPTETAARRGFPVQEFPHPVRKGETI
jgi:two-component sensor histidine kinase